MILLPPFFCLQITGLIDCGELDPEIDGRDDFGFLVPAEKLLTRKSRRTALYGACGVGVIITSNGRGNPESVTKTLAG